MFIFKCLHAVEILRIAEELMVALSNLWNTIQRCLFPVLEDELGKLSEKQQEFVRICKLCDLEKHIGPYHGSIMNVNAKNACRCLTHLSLTRLSHKLCVEKYAQICLLFHDFDKTALKS